MLRYAAHIWVAIGAHIWVAQTGEGMGMGMGRGTSSGNIAGSRYEYG